MQVRINSKILFITVLLILIFNMNYSNAQNTRINKYHNIGWYNFFGTFKLNPAFSIHTEYQFRRTDFGENWQQSLLRLGINYQLHPKILLRAGYGWIETYAYGDIPVNNLGKQFTEHRIFETITFTDQIKLIELIHRFTFEQRFVGRYSNINETSESEYVYSNSARYMFRTNIPLTLLNKKYTKSSISVYDELFISFGENVNENVFNQNRFGVLYGYKFNKTIKLEAGYLNQILQLGREVNGSNVFQHNNGVIVNVLLNFDLSKSNQ